MRQPDQRAAIAVIGSVAAHALLALVLVRSGTQLTAPPPRPIETALIEIATPRPPVPPAPSPPAAPIVPVRPAPRAPVRASAPKPVNAIAHESGRVEPVPAMAHGTLEVASTLPATGDGSGDAAAVVGGTGKAEQGSGTTTPSIGGSSRAQDVKAEIQALLAARAARCYPPPAARLGLTGATDVHFCVGATGNATEIRVDRSSGEALLDRAATECVVEGAGPLPAFDGCLVVPVEFQRRR